MTNAADSPWTDSRIEELERLWTLGYSCAQIAAAISVTRNAVIGKSHRLRLPTHHRAHNVNGQQRMVDPVPQGTPRSSPRPRTRETVFKSREIKPRADPTVLHDAKPGLMTVRSVLTGQAISILGHKRPRLAREMTKNELRAMLTAAVQNTATMESQG